MNAPEENPYASPCVDEIVLAEPGEEEFGNREFTISADKIVGESPLRLPEVCFYCADDIVDEESQRKCAKFYRRRKLELEATFAYKLFYSTCSACAAADNAWRRRRNRAIYFILFTFIAGCVFYFAWIASLGAANADTSNEFLVVILVVLSGLLLLCGIGGFIGLCRSAYCEAKLAKRPELVRRQGEVMTIARAGKKFCQRFR